MLSNIPAQAWVSGSPGLLAALEAGDLGAVPQGQLPLNRSRVKAGMYLPHFKQAKEVTNDHERRLNCLLE